MCTKNQYWIQVISEGSEWASVLATLLEKEVIEGFIEYKALEGGKHIEVYNCVGGTLLGSSVGVFIVVSIGGGIGW